MKVEWNESPDWEDRWAGLDPKTPLGTEEKSLSLHSLILTRVYNDYTKGSMSVPKRMNFWKSSKRPLTPPPLIFGKSCCRFFKQLYSLKNHTCGIFLKSPGYESIKNNDPCCQIQSLNFKFWGWLGPRLLVH